MLFRSRVREPLVGDAQVEEAGPGDLRREELPVRSPASGELVLRIDAALTCGTDVKTLRRGHPVMIPTIPTVFGHEFAGTVAAVGPGVSRFREGDRVVAANSAPCGACPACRVGRPNLCDDLLFVNGAYGEFIVLPPRLVSRNVVPLAASLPAEKFEPTPSGEQDDKGLFNRVKDIFG